MFSLDLGASESKKYIFVSSNSKITGFIFYLDVARPESGLMTLTPRLDGIDTSASHRGNHFIITRRSDEVFNSEVLACPVDDTSATTMLVPHRERYSQIFVFFLINFCIEIKLKWVHYVKFSNFFILFFCKICFLATGTLKLQKKKKNLILAYKHNF